MKVAAIIGIAACISLMQAANSVVWMAERMDWEKTWRVWRWGWWRWPRIWVYGRRTAMAQVWVEGLGRGELHLIRDDVEVATVRPSGSEWAWWVSARLALEPGRTQMSRGTAETREMAMRAAALAVRL
jgi:hypothetical protein